MYETAEAVVRPLVRIVLERAEHNWAAYAPAVPGCVATGRTRRSTERNMREALTFHFEGLDEDGRREIAAIIERDMRSSQEMTAKSVAG
jgi:predicted RNase H-like HicB family nuclease